MPLEAASFWIMSYPHICCGLHKRADIKQLKSPFLFVFCQKSPIILFKSKAVNSCCFLFQLSSLQQTWEWPGCFGLERCFLTKCIMANDAAAWDFFCFWWREKKKNKQLRNNLTPIWNFQTSISAWVKYCTQSPVHQSLNPFLWLARNGYLAEAVKICMRKSKKVAV